MRAAHVLNPPHTFAKDSCASSCPTSHRNYSISHAKVPELEWLHFDARERRLYGTPTHPGTWPVNINATDPGFRDGADPPLSTIEEVLLHVRDSPIPRGRDYWEHNDELKPTGQPSGKSEQEPLAALPTELPTLENLRARRIEPSSLSTSAPVGVKDGVEDRAPDQLQDYQDTRMTQGDRMY